LEGIFYRRSFLKSWLRCVVPLQADYVIQKIHEGLCGMHARPRSVVAKAMRSGPRKGQVPDSRYELFHKMDRSKVTDNGKQFSGDPFKDWCKKLNIMQRFASVKHPQSNELIERANMNLGEGIKSRLGEGNKNWLEELPHVLWAHHTMIKSSNDDTPLSLPYGTEAIIPAAIGLATYRTAIVDVVHNDEEIRLNLDLLGNPNDASHAVDGGKLGPKCEGPYEVIEALGDGAYKLRSTYGTILPRTWNIANLKKCYL
nr:reverse transcriptase domain-containing protein [Tanacetum cinerariifolium]